MGKSNNTSHSCIIVGLLLLALTAVTAKAQEGCRQKDGTPCYFIAINSVVEKNLVPRQMTVLLDPVYFNEADLKKIARHLLQQYPEPKEAHISLRSNIDQLRDQILHVIEQTEPNEADWKYPLGVVLRNKGNEVIRYSDPKSQEPGTVRWKTIVLKGRDSKVSSKQ